ncbi:MAG: alpha/beta hydrolase [Planctomycetota bacterium]
MGAPAEGDRYGDALPVEHRYADNDGVRIHYALLGEGPTVVLLHGFPDYWYTWRHQIPALAAGHRVAAVDLRGYNRSDAPRGEAHYAMPHLVRDVLAVLKDLGVVSASIVGHDWGAAIGWELAMHVPTAVERLAVLSVPHPAGLLRELATNPEQREASRYAWDFQSVEAHRALTAERLAEWVQDPPARRRYVEAFERSDFQAMLHYYRQNYPAEAGRPARPAVAPPPVRVPVLVVHGKDDAALRAAGHGGTWEWVHAEMNLLLLHGVGHFVQHEASERVTRALLDWLRPPVESKS